MRYKFTNEADKDLSDIYEYGFLNFGEKQAESYCSALEHSFQLLAEMPYICRERLEFIPPVRIHHYGRHLVVYIVQADQILVIRLLHQSMDIQRHLAGF